MDPKSRAGLIAYPAFAPKEMPIATTTNPMSSGARFAFTGEFHSSDDCKISITKNAVPMT